METQRSKERELSLEGLKGLAAFAVAFFVHYFHFTDTPPLENIFPFLHQNGAYAVELFFMLSGFGMMRGYGERIRGNGISFAAYMKRCVLRIYPMHLFTLILVAVTLSIYAAQTSELFVYENYDIYHFVLNFLGLQTGIFGIEFSFNGPAWCISVFLLLYVVFYLVSRYTGSMKRMMIVSGVLAFYGIRLIGDGYGPLLNARVGRGLTSFFIGVLLEVVYEKGYLVGKELILYIALTFMVVSVGAFHFDKGELVGNVQMLVILCFAPALILSALHIRWLRAALSIRPLVYLGKLSMGIYLVHFPVQCIIKVVEAGAGLSIDYSLPVVWAIYVVCTCVFAMLSMKLTDFLVMKIKEEYRHKRVEE